MQPQVLALGENQRSKSSFKNLFEGHHGIEVQHKQFFVGEQHYSGWAPRGVVGFHWEAELDRKWGSWQARPTPTGNDVLTYEKPVGASSSHLQHHPHTGTLGSLSANVGGANRGLNYCSPNLPTLFYVFNRAHKTEFTYITQELGAWCNHRCHNLES